MPEGSSKFEIEAAARPAVRLTIEVSGFDLDGLDEADRETLENLLHDYAEVIGDSLVQGQFPGSLTDGVSQAQLEMHDIAARNATSGPDGEPS